MTMPKIGPISWGRSSAFPKQYPLLSGGDINLYSLFVERATSLVKPGGMVGLLTPSGIYADKTAASFFRSISSRGRIANLFDFENRKNFFKDVHASFKFCALIFGGEQRTFSEANCAFYLHELEAIKDPNRFFSLAPEDFSRVNPNTGTAPIFRTRRDAEITRRLYEQQPLLVDRSLGERTRSWAVRYHTMFHMTNDSHQFRTTAQLQSDDYYLVEDNHWRKGDEVYVALYEGKMVQAFDHRAASVMINEANLNRPGVALEANLEEHMNPGWQPTPQFWVKSNSFVWPKELRWTVAFKDATAPTNARTMIATPEPCPSLWKHFADLVALGRRYSFLQIASLVTRGVFQLFSIRFHSPAEGSRPTFKPVHSRADTSDLAKRLQQGIR